MFRPFQRARSRAIDNRAMIRVEELEPKTLLSSSAAAISPVLSTAAMQGNVNAATTATTATALTSTSPVLSTAASAGSTTLPGQTSTSGGAPSPTGGIGLPGAAPTTTAPIAGLTGIPPENGVAPLADASSRLNAQVIAGSILPTGTLEDESFVMVPSPFARLAGQEDDVILRSPALSGTRIGLGESFKGSNDNPMQDLQRRLFENPAPLGFLWDSDADSVAALVAEIEAGGTTS